jgi:3-oxoacyl-[acyl-carrier protein] reductase
MNSALSESDLDALKEETPLMKIGAPEDVASSALFLSSDEAGFITGAVLNVNGGIVI